MPRLPSHDEVLAQLAEDEARARRLRMQPPPPRMDEAAVELRAMGIQPADMVGVPSMTAVVDVMREPLPPRAPEPVPPKGGTKQYLCGYCGLVFRVKEYKTPGATAMARGRHQKTCEKKAVETAGG